MSPIGPCPLMALPDSITRIKYFTARSLRSCPCMLKGLKCQTAKTGEGRSENQCWVPQIHFLRRGPGQPPQLTVLRCLKWIIVIQIKIKADVPEKAGISSAW